MKILFDHQAFSYQDFGGVSRFYFELTSRLKAYDSVEVDISLKYSNNGYISDWEYRQHRCFFPGWNFRGKNAAKLWINRQHSEKLLLKSDFDIFHPTYYDTYFLKNLAKKPFVLTVYDMIYENFASEYHIQDPFAPNKKQLIEKAAKIVAISENTKKDIVKYYGIKESSVSVVYLGNSVVPGCGDHPCAIQLPQMYALYVGTRTNYKNFPIVVSSMRSIIHSYKSFSLVCAGGPSFSSEEKALFQEFGMEKNVFHIPVSNDLDLAYLYENAIVFVFPSLYEGFGIPILEAFNCSCPVVLSRSSCFPEIAGDAAWYFDPNNEEELSSALKSLLENETIRKDLIRRGLERKGLFSWDRCAEDYANLYSCLK